MGRHESRRSCKETFPALGQAHADFRHAASDAFQGSRSLAGGGVNLVRDQHASHPHKWIREDPNSDASQRQERPDGDVSRAWEWSPVGHVDVDLDG
jgi:hypothetical protein